jgi:uncharacterized membrane protein YphA (DoxX/SURF4 family)
VCRFAAFWVHSGPNLTHNREIAEEIMFENLTLVIIIITVLWLGAYAYYLYTSRQQKNIADEVEQLEKRLDEAEKRR